VARVVRLTAHAGAQPARCDGELHAQIGWGCSYRGIFHKLLVQYLQTRPATRWFVSAYPRSRMSLSSRKS
jgi:hypothetical protein